MQIHSQKDLQNVANEFLYSGEELSHEEREMFESLNFEYTHSSRGNVIIIPG